MEVDWKSSKLIFGEDVQKSSCHSGEILNLSKVMLIFSFVDITFSTFLLLLEDYKA